jgi:hypothetical protein
MVAFIKFKCAIRNCYTAWFSSGFAGNLFAIYQLHSLFLAEVAIAACDLAEVLGMAIGINLLFGIPLIESNDYGIGHFSIVVLN